MHTNQSQEFCLLTCYLKFTPLDPNFLFCCFFSLPSPPSDVTYHLTAVPDDLSPRSPDLIQGVPFLHRQLPEMLATDFPDHLHSLLLDPLTHQVASLFWRFRMPLWTD